MTKNPFRYFKTSRAVDHEGEVLENYVTKTRDKQAAFTFLKKAMKRYGSPRMVVTDRLLPYGSAMKEIGNEDRKGYCQRKVSLNRPALGSVYDQISISLFQNVT